MSLTTGKELNTFLTLLNTGLELDATLADVLVSNAKGLVEGERPWKVLEKTDLTKSVTPSFTWETAIDLSTITDFSEFYVDIPIVLWDGNNRFQPYILKPWQQRLYFKDVSNTAVYDENSKTPMEIYSIHHSRSRIEPPGPTGEPNPVHPGPQRTHGNHIDSHHRRVHAPAWNV